MKTWLTMFVSLAGFGVLVAWVTHWLCSAHPCSPLRLLRQLAAKWKGIRAKPGKTPEAKNPPEAA